MYHICSPLNPIIMHQHGLADNWPCRTVLQQTRKQQINLFWITWLYADFRLKAEKLYTLDERPCKPIVLKLITPLSTLLLLLHACFFTLSIDANNAYQWRLPMMKQAKWPLCIMKPWNASSSCLFFTLYLT